MKSLPILTLVVLIGTGTARLASAWQEPDAATISEEKPSVSQAETEPEEHPQAIAVIHESRDRLIKTRSLTARIVQKATLGAYNFASEGNYVSASDLRFRFEYRAKLGKMEGQFLEVSDGQVIHTRKQIGKISTSTAGLTEIPSLEASRRDLQTILRARRQNQDQSDAVLAADAGIGGLPAVLASLEQNLIFDAVKKETVDGRPMTVIRGQWRKNRRDTLMTALGPMAPQLGPLLPDQVRITLDDETMVPRQFLYLKLVSEERKTYRPILTVDVLDVELGGPLADQLFTYSIPPGMQERDDTDLFLQMISGAAAASSTENPSPPAGQE